MTKITLSGGTTIELSAEQLRELGAKIAEAVEGKEEEVSEFKAGDIVVVIKRECEHELGALLCIVKKNDGYYDYRVSNASLGRNGYINAENIRHATAEEVAEYEKSRIFTENGRKPNEYRVDDVVQIIGNVMDSVNSVGDVGVITEVDRDDDSYRVLVKKHDNAGNWSALRDIKPLVFVEQRLDRKH